MLNFRQMDSTKTLREWQEKTQGSLTKEEREEFEILKIDPGIEQYFDLGLPDNVFENLSDETVKKLEEFKKQHPEIIDKVKRLYELRQKLGKVE